MRKTLLIVEDEPPIVQFLEKYLLPSYDLDTFESAEDAQENFEIGKYAVALIDIHLKKKSGTVLQNQIGRLDSRLVCIGMTGYAIEEAESEEFDFFLEKPFTIEELDETLHAALQLHDMKL
jgi:DNA-binding NtrC family response regulator